MPQQVCNGALLQCSMGVAPSSLTVLPINRVNTAEQPDANVMDSSYSRTVRPQGGKTWRLSPSATTKFL
jgi:hypothetical protein